MSILGIHEATVASLVRPLGGVVDDRSSLAERFARATWTGIAEPGDRTAGAVIQALGAEGALAALLEDREGRMLRHALADADAVSEIDDCDVTEAVKRWSPRLSKETALRSLTQAARFAVELVTPDDADWPRGLDDLGEHAPIALWMRGDRGTLGALDASVAIVGARAATGYGEHVTVELSAGLVDRGAAVVSGAAYGIDGAAHRAALASHGTTVAFLAGGLDRFYPAGHDALLGRIVEQGAALSEVPCGTAPTRWRFLLRNRLISAASRATIVVEAGARSGSLNTAGHAAALGRPLGAVPGPVTSSASAGCHRLLREYDAVCVTTAAEAAELAGFTVSGDVGRRDAQSAADTSAGSDPTGTRVRLLDAVAPRTARTPDEIARISGLGVDRVRAELGLLELDGVVRSRGAGWVKGTPAQGGGAP